MKHLLILLILIITTNITWAHSDNKSLAERIAKDHSLVIVDSMARALLKENFYAGSVYQQVWCRDLNTFIETACEEYDLKEIRKAILNFFAFQQPNGEMVDGYEKKGMMDDGHLYYSETAPDLTGHKNTVESDQETSLIQLISKYILKTGDKSIFKECVDGITVKDRMNKMIMYLLTYKYIKKYGLIYGMTTIDWGDVQPNTDDLVHINIYSRKAIDIYDNAMFIIALNYLSKVTDNPIDRKKYIKLKKSLASNVRKYLWDKKNQKFIPHIYIDGSPFPDSFEENKIYYHGGTAVAIEAGLLTKKEILSANSKMLDDVSRSGMATIGLTIYPVYPEGYFHLGMSRPYFYQNGGDWTWFGGRMIKQLIRYGFVKEAYEEMHPMIERVIKTGRFYEWYGKDSMPMGSKNYKGCAGVLSEAINLLWQWCRKYNFKVNNKI